MRVHIFDPQLNLVNGHYAAYDAAVAAELAARHVETHLYGNTQHRSLASARLDAEPVFSRDIFEEVASDRLTWALENFVQLSRDFHGELANVGADRFDRDDLAFFPNIIQYQICGIRDWIAEIPAERRPALVLKPSYLTYAMPYLQHRPNKEMVPLLYRYSVRQLVSTHARTWICSDTEQIVKQMGSLVGIPMHLLPLPLIMEKRQIAAKDATDASRVNIVYLGHASMLKGFHLLADTVKRVVAAGNAAHFIIQSYGEQQLCVPLREAVAGTSPDKLTLIEQAVDFEEYTGLLNRADIVLLPYAKEFYGWASSGIFSEAMSLGKIVIVTEGTWAAEQLEKFAGGGLAIKAPTVDHIADAITVALRTLTSLQERALKAASAWRRYHCPENFVDTLIGLVSRT
jgi:glycosyltransferase involved in cell wall biosynthesis